MNFRPTIRIMRSATMPIRSATLVTAALALGAALLPATGSAQESGEKIALERCAACHGKDGNTPIDPSYPRLAGQHEDYLAEAMRAYRSDRRKNAIMGAQAKLLSNEDIRNLAAYYARLPGSMNHSR